MIRLTWFSQKYFKIEDKQNINNNYIQTERQFGNYRLVKLFLRSCFCLNKNINYLFNYQSFKGLKIEIFENGVYIPTYKLLILICLDRRKKNKVR